MQNIVFIVGCGHSGTSILNKILSNHKNIYGLNYETNIFLKYDRLEILLQFQKLNLERISANKKWLCEKTPNHVYHIDKIFDCVESPKVIVITRDGRDVVSSLNKRYSDFQKSVNRWIDDNNEWYNHKYKKFFHILKYEDLVNNTKNELASICYYLGESYDNNMLNYNRKEISLPNDIFNKEISGKSHEILRLYQINQKLYDGSKRYLKDLSEEQINQLSLNESFVTLMKKLAYF